jgi:hypothetical protein
MRSKNLTVTTVWRIRSQLSDVPAPVGVIWGKIIVWFLALAAIGILLGYLLARYISPWLLTIYVPTFIFFAGLPFGIALLAAIERTRN